VLRFTDVSVHVQGTAWVGGRPPLDWLVLANRHALVTRLLSATVHDVNNTLQVVSGAAEVLAMDPTPEAVTKRTASIVTQARQATAVLHALAAFAGDTFPAASGARPKAIAEQAVALRLYALRKARIAVTVSGDECPCAASHGRVLQVLLNFLVNAEQALGGRPGATLAVRVHTAPAHVSIAVEDNGPGLPEGHGAAFGGWPPQPSGTGQLGIGLLVSQALSGRDGGAVTHAPTPGGGATFVLTIPR
jgi:C4-dicarboxylate-specific signal transduction histidine kinase